MTQNVSETVQKLTIRRPDDWHIHLRDGEALIYIVPHAVAQFGRAIVMPNLKPPVATLQQAADYRNRILDMVSSGSDFTPLMTLYLTDHTTVNQIRRAKVSGIVHAVKFYPAGATTNSDAGVTNIEKAYDVLGEMERYGLPLLVHGEVTDPRIDIFDRERVFIETVLAPILERFPELKVVMEHITTKDAVEFIKSAGPKVAATVTAHHLLYNRNAIFQGGIRPHWYCLPVLKREEHREALLQAVISGNPKFFLGSDSASHAKLTKEAACGCAGCYTAYAAIELYTEAFDLVGALDKLEDFASSFGADFYGLPRNEDTITLVREEWVVPDSFSYIKDDVLIPLRAGETIQWKRIWFLFLDVNTYFFVWMAPSGAIFLSSVYFCELLDVPILSEIELELDILSINDTLEPVWIVFPHSIIGDISYIEPLWFHLFGFFKSSSISMRNEDIYILIPLWFSSEVEVEYSSWFQFFWSDYNRSLFLEFSCCGFYDSLSYLNLATCTIPLSFPKPTFFHREEDLIIRIEYEYEGRLTHNWKRNE